MQSLTIDGRLGRDAEVKSCSNGQNFLTFTVAVNSKKNGTEKTTWYDVISFQEQHVKKLSEYLKKGTYVLVVGELDADIVVGKDGVSRQSLKLNADRIHFGASSLSGSTQSNTTETAQKGNGSNPKQVAEEMPLINKPKNEETKPSMVVEDDLPF